MKKQYIIIPILAALAGVIYFGWQLQKNATPGASTSGNSGTPATTGLQLRVKKDSLLLYDDSRLLLTVMFDSGAVLRPGSYGYFDSLVSKTEFYTKSQLNYPKNKAFQWRGIADEKQSIADFLRECGITKFTDSLPLRQLLFQVVLDTVVHAEKTGKLAMINANKEIVHALQQGDPVVKPSAAGTPSVTPLLVCTGILSLLSLFALFSNNKQTMAKARRKKPSESEEEYLKHTVYEMLGKDTAEARYFTDVLSNHKRWQSVKDQLKPEGKPDTGTLINNMKDAGLLTPGESRTLYDLHELKEKISAIKAEGTGNHEKQQHLMGLLQSFTKDEPLKQHLQQSASEGLQWQQLMNLDEKDLPAALQHLLRFYDEKYGGGAHKLSPVYAETLRRSQQEIPENFAQEDRFLKALYQQYRNLLDDVLYNWFAQQHSEEKVAEARQAFVNRLAQLAFHAHSFLTHYNKDIAALPPATVKANMQLVVDGGTVTGSLPKDAYRSYSRDITRFEREIFLQKLLSGMGVTNLDNVLLKDVYYPKEGLE